MVFRIYTFVMRMSHKAQSFDEQSVLRTPLGLRVLFVYTSVPGVCATLVVLNTVRALRLPPRASKLTFLENGIELGPRGAREESASVRASLSVSVCLSPLCVSALVRARERERRTERGGDQAVPGGAAFVR